MNNLSIAAQLIIALGVAFVWIFRLDNIIVEFKEYKLSDLVRNLVGATKISMATLLLAGIWYPALVLYPALVMAFLMACAQWFHFKARHPLGRYLPSFALLILSLLVAAIRSGILPK